MFDERIDNEIDSIVNAIEKSPNIEEDTIQFRGGHWEVGTKVGDVIQQEGFASICYDESYAGNFNDRPSRYDITYLVPAGTKGVWLSEPFNNLGEDEYLTPPGTNLYVLEVDNKNKNAKVVILPEL